MQYTLSFVGHTCLVLALVLAAGACQPGDGTSPAPAAGGGDYQFKEDWFSHNIPVWTEVLAPYRGQPDLQYLEVGVYEGRSFFWMLDNILTHPSTRLTGIDKQLYDNLLHNVEISGAQRRIRLIEGFSQIELRSLAAESFDIIYIDGSHAADDVLADAVMSWELLKPGGLLILDDYEWDGSHMTGDQPLPAELVPGPGIDAFYRNYRYEIEVVQRGYQMLLRKRTNPCGELKTYCSPLGDYVYDWADGLLYDPGDLEQPVSLSEAEHAMVEQILRGDPIDAGSPELRRLCERLGIYVGH